MRGQHFNCFPFKMSFLMIVILGDDTKERPLVIICTEIALGRPMSSSEWGQMSHFTFKPQNMLLRYFFRQFHLHSLPKIPCPIMSACYCSFALLRSYLNAFSLFVLPQLTMHHFRQLKKSIQPYAVHSRQIAFFPFQMQRTLCRKRQVVGELDLHIFHLVNMNDLEVVKDMCNQGPDPICRFSVWFVADPVTHTLMF